MDNEVVFDVRGVRGAAIPHVTPRAQMLDLLGLNVVAMPPGRVELEASSMPTAINVVPSSLGVELFRRRLNGELVDTQTDKGAAYDLFAPKQDIEISAINKDWELLIELDEQAPNALLAEAVNGLSAFSRSISSGRDPSVLTLTDMTIRHLRFGEPDRLYTEGLALALTARVFALSDERMREVPTTGTDRRIDRAIDYIEAHLCEPMSVADLASVAAMSSSWFAACFKARTGRPVHAYVLQRRLDRARTMISGSNVPLVHVARSCGFADQAHMSRAFKARFGVRPSEGR